MLLSECAVCNSKKSRFTKEQEARRLLNSLELRAPLSEVSLWGPLLVLKVYNESNNKQMFINRT